MSFRTVFYTLAFLFFVVVAGYLRETLFVHIAWHEAALTDKYFSPEPHWLFPFLKNMDIRQLLITRYVATVFFVIVFWALSMLMIKFFFPNQSMKAIHFIFACVFTAGFFLFLMGYVLPWPKSLYEMARWTIGLIETPLIIVLLFPFLWLRQNEHLFKNKA
ncbi:MAG TPA: hypothetical protein VD905_15105 [Flavobacteriales bacterium]|nr:hypothetical protein [Flavobacteriales bacterium]